jgi:hypothetical protein
MCRSAILAISNFFGTSIGINLSPSVAKTLSNDVRKGFAIQLLSKAEPITHLADREGVSRQFLYRQKQKAVEAIDGAFAANDADVQFYLPSVWMRSRSRIGNVKHRSNCGSPTPQFSPTKFIPRILLFMICMCVMGN